MYIENSVRMKKYRKSLHFYALPQYRKKDSMLESYKRISFLFFWAEFGPRVDQAIEPIKISFERDIKSPREGEQAESGQCLPAASPGHGQRHSEFEPIRSGGYHECWRGSRENGIHCSTSQHYLYWVFHCFKCFIDLSFWTACLTLVLSD